MGIAVRDCPGVISPDGSGYFGRVSTGYRTFAKFKHGDTTPLARTVVAGLVT